MKTGLSGVVSMNVHHPVSVRDEGAGQLPQWRRWVGGWVGGCGEGGGSRKNIKDAITQTGFCCLSDRVLSVHRKRPLFHPISHQKPFSNSTGTTRSKQDTRKTRYNPISIS